MSAPRLQNFDFRSSTYERPSQTWVCGRSSTGCPCERGPDQRGRCRTTTECQPRRSGDGWACNRPAAAGGACSQGPLEDGRCCRTVPPCMPVRSLRSRRGLTTVWATLLSLAALFVIFGGSMNAQLLHPGPMIKGHAEIQNCASCHVAFEGGPLHWLAASLRPSDPLADSSKCLACHNKTKDALNPHNLGKPKLDQLTEIAATQHADTSAPWTVDASRFAFPLARDAADGPLACAACHEDHHGEWANMMQVANARCQSCHTVTFEAFSSGHPGFGSYPYLRRTRISFDHDSHNRKHFPEEAKKGTRVPETCDTCHEPDSSGHLMVTTRFEQACASCHGKDITGDTVAGVKGVPVIALPELDVDTIAERGLWIGEWPEDAIAPKISPFTKLLLAADPTTADDLKVVDELDLLDLSDANDGQLAAVGRVVWGIKELLYDIATSGMGILQTRVEASLNHSLDADTVGRLIGHIPQDVIVAAARVWFSRLSSDVVRFRSQKAAGVTPGVIHGDSGSDKLSDQQLLQLDDDQIDPGDELLQLDEAGQPSGDVKVRAKKAAAAEPEPEAEPAAAPEPEAAETAAEPAEPAEPAAEDTAGDEAPAEPAAAGEPPRPVARPATGDLAAAAATDLETIVDPEEWAEAGGWFRKDFTLYYRPVEHEDSFVRTWLDIGANAFGTPAEHYGEALFAMLNDKNTPGRCTKCHSVDRQPGGALMVNWQPFQPKSTEVPFTNFVHDAHFSALEDKGCVACHQLSPGAKYQDSYQGQDPTKFVSNFAPMQRELCAECHVQSSAGDNCTMCHQYHIGDFTQATMSTKMAALDQPATAGAAPAPAAPAADANAPPAADVPAAADAPATALPAAPGVAIAEAPWFERLPQMLASMLQWLAPGVSHELERPDLPQMAPDAAPTDPAPRADAGS